MTAPARSGAAVELIRSRLPGDASERILFVTNMWPEASRSWYGPFVYSQANSLEDLGIPIDVLYIRGHASRWAYGAGIGRVVRLNRKPGWKLVHAHYGHAGVVARFQTRLPFVMSYCGDDLLGTRVSYDQMTLRSRIEAGVFRQLARVADATITKSEAMEAELPASCRGRNRVIPNGVDLDRLHPVPRDEARRALGWPSDEPVALFVGNPEYPNKNYALAAAACDRLRGNDGDLRLEVAWEIDPTEIPLRMSGADALVLTSISEGSPNVVKEAMACELPVVATAVGDVPERLTGIPGCYVARPDPDDVATGLRTAIGHGRSPEARRAVEELSLRRVAERVREVYDEVLERRGAPAIGRR